MLTYRECKKCHNSISTEILDKNFSICPNCGNYMRFHALKRIFSLADKGSFVEYDKDRALSNPLNDTEYYKKLLAESQKHNLKDAIITGEIKINGYRTAIGVMDSRFMMASLGHTVGEEITRLFERAILHRLPVILFCCSGGARMQEGIISLMQMEKTAAAVKRHSDAGLLYISVLTNPTMGGVSASFAFLADIILAEKGALIGFAGPRVIRQNTGIDIPDNFQSSEFQLKHGFIDKIVTRENMKADLTLLLHFHRKPLGLDITADFGRQLNSRAFPPVSSCETDNWSRVMAVRSAARPDSLQYIDIIFKSFTEFHGDRLYSDDAAIVGGIAEFYGQTVTVIAEQKGKRDINDAIFRNWGMASPEGYRKALRLMRQAEKFNRPIICFIDTIGAACGIEAEENGQSAAIGTLLRDMSTLKIPILSIVISEGESGGALALGVANEVWMLENAIYSVISPEGYASIVWKDNTKAPEASKIMKISSYELKQLGVIDKIIYEPDNLSSGNINMVCNEIKCAIFEFFKKYNRYSSKKIVNERLRRFRKF